jgi:hypothetical protein
VGRAEKDMSFASQSFRSWSVKERGMGEVETVSLGGEGPLVDQLWGFSGS